MARDPLVEACRRAIIKIHGCPRLIKAGGWWWCGSPLPGEPGLLDARYIMGAGRTPAEAWRMWAGGNATSLNFIRGNTVNGVIP